MGNGTTTDSPTPVTVTGISSAIHIAAGMLHSCALLDDGTIKCWGNNSDGQLGDRTTTDSSVPVTATTLSGITQVAAGGRHSCALTENGAVKCWGSNGSYQLGDGTGNDSVIPVPVNEIGGYSNCRLAPVNPLFETNQPTNATVYRLYCAYFLRYPDTGGFGYWLGEYEAHRVGLGGISDLFSDSEEFRLTYGHLNNQEFLHLVYANVMERAPDSGGFTYWSNLINNRTISRGDVMLYFAESQEFRNKTGT